MIKQQKKLAKLVHKISNFYFDTHAKSRSLNKDQSELLSGAISHLMMAQSSLNKYVNSKKGKKG